MKHVWKQIDIIKLSNLVPHYTSFYVAILPLNSLFALCHTLILYQILFNIKLSNLI